jgi:hypothetical protein
VVGYDAMLCLMDCYSAAKKLREQFQISWLHLSASPTIRYLRILLLVRAT